MFVFNSIRNNFRLFPIHINIWLFKFLIIYFSFEPLRIFLSQFFQGKTINKRLFDHSDASALFEFIWEIISIHGNPLLPIIFVILLISVFMLVLDSLIDCGFIASYSKRDKSIFWASLKENANRMILLKIVLLIPYLFMLTLISVTMFYIFDPRLYQFPIGTNNLIPTMILLIGVTTIGLFFLRIIDHAKINLIIGKKSVSESILSGFSNMFTKSAQIAQVNFITAFLLAGGIYVYSVLNSVLVVDNSTMIMVITILFQLVIFLKQVLRFSYTGAIIDIDFEPKFNEDKE